MTRSRPPNRRRTARNRRSIPATWSALPSLPTSWGGRPRASAVGWGESLIQFRLPVLDEQDRNAVDDWVEDLAVRAPEVVGLLELELGVALGTGQNLEQFLRDHGFMVVPFRP